MFSVISTFKNEENNCENFLQMIMNTKKLIDINELIVIENGSSDNTLKKLKKFNVNGINIKIIDNKNSKGYGDGFYKGFKEVSNKYFITIHSDLQFDLYNFIKNNLIKINYYINQNTNIFPKRMNRTVIENLKTFIIRIFLSIFTKKYIIDTNGHPKILITNNFSDFNNPANGFGFDCCIFLHLIKNDFRFTNKLKIHVNKRQSGNSTWNKKIFNQIRLFGLYIKEVIIFYKS